MTTNSSTSHPAPAAAPASDGMGFDDYDAWTGAPISARARALDAPAARVRAVFEASADPDAL